MSEVQAACAERTIRSLKITLYRYMEDKGYKYVHKISHFNTNLNSRKKTKALIPMSVMNAAFLFILYYKSNI